MAPRVWGAHPERPPVLAFPPPRLGDFERVKRRRAKSASCRPFHPHCNMRPIQRDFQLHANNFLH